MSIDKHKSFVLFCCTQSDRLDATAQPLGNSVIVLVPLVLYLPLPQGTCVLACQFILSGTYSLNQVLAQSWQTDTQRVPLQCCCVSYTMAVTLIWKHGATFRNCSHVWLWLNDTTCCICPAEESLNSTWHCSERELLFWHLQQLKNHYMCWIFLLCP